MSKPEGKLRKYSAKDNLAFKILLIFDKHEFHSMNSNHIKPQSSSTWITFNYDSQLIRKVTKSQYDLVWKPSTLDVLIGYFTPPHVIHQRLLLHFLSAPEDGCKKRPKHVVYNCSY